MSFSEIVDSIDQQIDRVVTTVIEAHVKILLVIVICKNIYIYIKREFGRVTVTTKLDQLS